MKIESRFSQLDHPTPNSLKFRYLFWLLALISTRRRRRIFRRRRPVQCRPMSKQLNPTQNLIRKKYVLPYVLKSTYLDLMNRVPEIWGVSGLVVPWRNGDKLALKVTVHFWRRILMVGEIKGKETSVTIQDSFTNESDLLG